MELKDLKKEYEKLAKKYSLPKFEELNNEFEIERFDKQTEILARVVRRIAIDKIYYFNNFIESVTLNPMNAPRFYLPYVRNLTDSDKQKISKVYSEFAKLILASIECEALNDEKRDAELVKEIYKVWMEHKQIIGEVISAMRFGKNETKQKEGSYVG
ncbi:hypothetical protein D6817_00220 [Candidatus Pacearchaeota archaeon]|nr:MAG: hypothetical protein D6817_00220 [Candidatus Pacearchaeota archaeon]